MKHLIAIFLLLFSVLLCGQPINRTFEQANGSVNILGQATLEKLMSEPFRGWYDKNYDEYEVDTETMHDVTMPDSITIFMGTWCGDSKREVPRFIKVLEKSSFSFEKLRIICLNTGFQNYKQAPEREEAGQNIHRVPTFIFHSADKKEIGRIVEEPVVSLEADFKDIMEGEPYKTYYPVVYDLIGKFGSQTVSKMRKERASLVKMYKGRTVSEYELNTYGYVLWSSFRMVEAEFIFELNALLHPQSTTPFRTLSRFKSNFGKEKEAIKAIKRGLQIDPGNRTLLAMKANLE